MKFYVFDCINIFPPFYCLCITNMSHQSPIMITHKQHQNIFKLKSQFLSQFYFVKLYIYTTTYFYQVKVFSKVTNTFLYTIQKETKQKIS